MQFIAAAKIFSFSFYCLGIANPHAARLAAIYSLPVSFTHTIDIIRTEGIGNGSRDTIHCIGWLG